MTDSNGKGGQGCINNKIETSRRGGGGDEKGAEHSVGISMPTIVLRM